MFSVAGKKSFRITRRQPCNSSVFPAGCMGNNEPEQAVPERDSIREEDGAGMDEAPEQDGPQMDHAASGDAGDGEPAGRGLLGAQGHGAEAGASRPMYQYSGSNIQRNPLTGSGCNDEPPVTGKRRVGSKFGYKKMK